MNPLDQIRTVRGQYPVKRAECGKGNLDGSTEIRFTFVEPGQAKAEERAGRAPDLSIESIAFLCDSSFKTDHVLIEKIAQSTGPLFGPNKTEKLIDWIGESLLVASAIAIQSVVNSDEPDELRFGPFYREDGVCITKTRLTAGKGRPFLLFNVMSEISESSIPVIFPNEADFPQVKRYVTQAGYDYAFIGLSTCGQRHFLTISLFVFQHEITPLDYLVVCDQFASSLVDSEEDAPESPERKGNARGGEGKRTSIRNALIAKARALGIDVSDAEWSSSSFSREIESDSAPFDGKDAPHLQKLVHAIVSLNLEGVGVDFFCSDESDGYMLFPNYLSYLWYRFACDLDQVKIERCEVCGRGFSLVKARGKQRKYCSEQCKNEAKNAREKAKKEAARRMFLDEGRSVSSIAEEVYGNNRAKGKVRKLLAEYPALKHRLDDDLRAGTGGAFVKRCMREGVFTSNAIAARMKRLGIDPLK